MAKIEFKASFCIFSLIVSGCFDYFLAGISWQVLPVPCGLSSICYEFMVLYDTLLRFVHSHIFLHSEKNLQLFSTQSSHSFPNAAVVLSNARQLASAPCELDGFQLKRCLCKYTSEKDCGPICMVYFGFFFMFLLSVTGCLCISTDSINLLLFWKIAFIPM